LYYKNKPNELYLGFLDMQTMKAPN